MARTAKDKTCSHGLCETSCLADWLVRVGGSGRSKLYLIADLFLIFSWEIDKLIVLSADQERNGSLVEASTLSVPLFDAIEGRFSSQVEHEEDGDGIIAHEGQHVDKFALTTQIPDGECNFCISY